MKRALKVIGSIVVGLVLLVVALLANLERVVLWVMRPSKPFSLAAAPPAPDYARGESWSALPDRDDAADAVREGLAPRDQRAAPVDVFYLHPTSFVAGRWNATVPDPGVDKGTDALSTRIQASAFNHCCAVYAPRYRQTNGLPFIEPSADGDRAADLAYSDVRRAFDAFNARRGAGRPFVLVSHSQGSVFAERLLYEAISRTPLREKLVAAYIIGGRMTEEGLRVGAPDIPVCASATQTRCVIAYNTRMVKYTPSRWELRLREHSRRVCVNPLNWRADGLAARADENLGAVFLETDRSLKRAFADGQCIDGFLRVRSMPEVPRSAASAILDDVMGQGNLHPMEFQLFHENLRVNVGQRVAAMLAP